MNPGKSMRVNRFVLDANIWVSYLNSGVEQKAIYPIQKMKMAGF
jgi:hypothetical protein